MKASSKARIGQVVDRPDERVPEIGRVKFVMPGVRGAHQVNFDFASRIELARDLAIAWRSTNQIRRQSRLTHESRDRYLRVFLNFLSGRGDLNSKSRLKDLEESDFDDFESHLRQVHPPQSHQPRIIAGSVLVVLRSASRMGLLSQSLKDRSRYPSDGGPVRTNVVDAYSTSDIHQVRKVAKAALRATLLRFNAARREAATGQTVGRLCDARTDADVLRWIFEKGPIPYSTWKSETQRPHSEWKRQHRQVFAGPGDVVGPMALLILETGLERESLLNLCRSDLEFEEGAAFARLKSEKLRARGNEHQEIVVEMDRVSSAGRMFLLIWKLTATAREASADESDVLLQVRSIYRGVENYGPVSPKTLWGCFQELRNETDMRENLNPQRLRKSQKSQRYRETKGILSEFALGHSIPVAGKHYANLPALMDVHEQAIEQGLLRALNDSVAAADAPKVVPGDHPGAEEEQGAQLWIASCQGFTSSPFAPEGSRCPVPLTGCVQCSNAVITQSKLPALLRLKEVLAEKAQNASLESWVERWGVAYVRIEQILAQFPDEATASAVADPDSLYISAVERFKHV